MDYNWISIDYEWTKMGIFDRLKGWDTLVMVGLDLIE